MAEKYRKACFKQSEIVQLLKRRQQKLKSNQSNIYIKQSIKIYSDQRTLKILFNLKHHLLIGN